MPTLNIRRLALAAAAACALTLPVTALARGAFDGAWSVEFAGHSGTCDGLTYSYEVQVTNGVLRYSGADAHITGRISDGGEVTAHVSTADSSATGSGRVGSRYGRGRFYGRSSSGSCSGTWTALRSGG